MVYPYEDLGDDQFERLVVQCMKKLFGAGVQSFAAGIDGGRDALFIGTAERYPSTAEPWIGTTIGQAKHTLATNVHFSDADFSGDADSAVLSKEAVRVHKLVVGGHVDNYILFANRRLGGVTEPKIRTWFAGRVGLPADRVRFAGVEYLDDLILSYPDVVALAKIDALQGPLLVSSVDLAEVILAIADELAVAPAASDAPVTDRVSYTEKNDVNRMTADFAATLSKNYLRYSQRIEDFLAEPSNVESRRRYEAAVEDFQLKVIEKRADFVSFDAVFNHLIELLVGRDGVLSRNRKLLRAVLFYMYWHCDIGTTPDAPTE